MIHPKPLHFHLRHLQHLLPLKAWYILYVQSDPTLLKLAPHAPAHTKKCKLGHYDLWRYDNETSIIGSSIYYYIKAQKQGSNIKMLNVPGEWQRGHGFQKLQTYWGWKGYWKHFLKVCILSSRAVWYNLPSATKKCHWKCKLTQKDKDSKVSKRNKYLPLVQSCQLFDTRYPQIAQVPGPCILFGAAAPHRSIAIQWVSTHHFHLNLSTWTCE